MSSRVNLLGLGSGLLFISLLATMGTNGESLAGEPMSGRLLGAWVARTAWWLGMLCIAAHLAEHLLAAHRDRSRL